ncbi:hypothetical protein ACHAPE_009905 [Trichoderma viride]
MSKVATVQFKSIPVILDLEASSTQWTFPMPRSLPSEALILDTHFEGMTVLNDVETEKHCADCIAISGLGSHPFGSWQPHGADKSFMWIRDELPRSVPGVRAVLYGYDSRLISSNSFQSISGIARGLILDLKSGGWNFPSSRPIIFLAHSLGGIVLKDAIVQIADSGDKSVANILDNLLGAIMFGVPSLGMHQSHLMAMVEGQANEMLVQDLSRQNGSSYLRQLNISFNGLSIVHTVKILWAYETEESPTNVRRSDGSWCKKGPLAVLVNTDSATCHYYSKDKSLTIPINKDHSNMVKFSRGDNDLGKIIVSLKELCSLQGRLGQLLLATNDASQNQQSFLRANVDSKSTGDGILTEDSELLIDLGSVLSLVQEIHDELYLPELDYRITQIEDPFQNTFKWIFDLDLFTHWLREGSGLFWINGKPGSGKSTLMKFIFQNQLTEDLLHHWRKNSLDIKAGFFFNYRGTAIQKSFEGVLRSLITQILQPHRIAFQKKYQRMWETFQDLNKRSRILEGRRANLKCELDAVIERKALTNSERDLEEQLQRAIDDSGSEARKKQVVRDIKEQLSQVRKKRKGVRKWNTESRERELELQLLFNQLQADIAVISDSISSLAKEARPFRTQLETRFLRSIVAEFRNDSDSRIVRLERILSQLLDQDLVKIDLVLFFDALDEFDGHLDKMSGFLKSLIERSATSATRAKVCFSSRPWKSLNDHFAKYPSFKLQDYTKADIEQYGMGSLERSEIINLCERDNIMKIIPSVIARANGVFLWVRLAMKELFDTIAKSSKAELFENLEKKLQELPSDLFEFYKHIIERIIETNRRYTFALLELLARHTGPPATATDIWSAVLISGCTTYQQSLDALQCQSGGTNQCIATDSDWDPRITNDILAWGGGLVEIKAQNHLQLMHQTVLEFTVDQKFKRIVMGDVAAILNENGHSFYFKYGVVKIILRRYSTANSRWITGVKLDHLKQSECKLAAYHAEKSESTTGISQIDFITTIPTLYLHRLLRTAPPIYDTKTLFLTFASSFGLTLCIRDWIARNPGKLRRISLQCEQPPLLASLAFKSASGDLHEGHLATARLLLENGYSIAKDTKFFPSLLEKVREAEAEAVTNDSNAQAVIMPTIHKLATLVLDHGQDPNMLSTMSSWENQHKFTLLHMAPPGLAAELIRRKANVNTPDSRGRTPLDWMLKPPHWSLRWSRARCYQMCCLLVNAGGLLSSSTPAKAWMDVLAEFDNEGYDTQVLRSKDPVQHRKFKTALRLLF